MACGFRTGRRYSLARVLKLLLSACLLTACHHPSKCERFADMEAKCGDIPQHELAKTRTMARGICEAASSKDPSVAQAGAQFAQEADCAVTSPDCDEYRKCRDRVDGVKPEDAK